MARHWGFLMANELGAGASCSPSPRPSPLGRGRIIARPSARPARQEVSRDWPLVSVSLLVPRGRELLTANELGAGASCSPSPRPSPLGRGRIAAKPSARPARQEVSRGWPPVSLSLRERAGVRGNRMLDHPQFLTPPSLSPRTPASRSPAPGELESHLSPLGRARIVTRPSARPACQEVSRDWPPVSLSLRERAGVRGNRMLDHPQFPTPPSLSPRTPASRSPAPADRQFHL